MKNKIYKLVLWVALILSVQTVSAAGKNCTAGFTYTIDTEVSSLTYLFTDISSSNSQILSWSWDFGDGSNSVNQNPEHQYLLEGTYVVSLHIVCSDGSTDAAIDTIEVRNVMPPSCTAYFTSLADTSLSPYSYKFTDHSVSPNDTVTSWSWDFGDGTANVSNQNPVHQFSSTGSFTVTLNIGTSKGCSASYSDVVVVSNNLPACNASFTFSADSVTGNNTLIFFFDKSTAADPIVAWHWDFADGDSAVAQNPVHIFPYQGVYDVVLTITTQSGCSSSMHYPIQVGNPQKYNMWGRVYLGNLTTDKCIALLYKEYSNGYIVPIDTVRLTSVNDTLGVYYFYQILEGKHKIKVILPESSNYDKLYAPTYFGDNLFWNMTSSMNLFQDLSLMNVNMEPVVQQSGSCYISGAIMKNNVPINYAGVQVLLLDASHNVYAYTFSDSQGQYVFEDVPTGNYLVYAELTGLYALPAQIAFASATDTINNVNVHLTSKNAMVSIDQALVKDINLDLTLYPNPVNEQLNVRINQHDVVLKYEIVNSLGQLVAQGIVDRNTTLTHINMSEIKTGLYILRLFTADGEVIENKKFIRR